MNKLLQSLSAIGVSATLVSPNLNAEATSNSIPQIKGVEDGVIELGENFNLRNGISAYDKEDGDLTDKIKINGHVDTDKPGKYKITYEVRDSDGATDLHTRFIEVIDQ
ncbi:DUF5011 domain-containing protein [Staphylococcus massiliensis]|uniref:Putative secreted protein n=1 Tax=Staphylococcus massiliensis S46 TaxID=1229783 RepID=K9AK90_9STAP|nr:DUF5011 domain-containing protein [Staphylococcus massiliensis]EKU47763.1 putative secreted protein [Staphylococcus massiliensis S46]MCG3399790.1 DUF5011 domain-containing protein [Staphylococcus massiliensis]MCG3401528.1 DUF5011 domain-containing protein [Staphylococcus massiliensis]MCG3413404.1 DUF5011 domain-containing protein [Staphylococcus massiliensis]POA01624.1 DUF5011 domain-containing protein [Staphylococcus massiliensis CCUG 55927]